MDWSVFDDGSQAISWIRKEKGMTATEASAYMRANIPKESYYQAKVIALIKSRCPAAFVWKAGAGVYARQGIPDVCAVIGGRFYGFEVKRPFLGEVTNIQRRTIDQINAAGGNAYVVSFPSEVEEILRKDGVIDDR